MHSAQRTAITIIENPERFSHASLRYAKLINNAFDDHRKNVEYLCKNRSMLREYRTLYSNCLNVQRIQKSRYASMIMRDKYTEEQMIQFHKFRGSHRQMHIKLGVEILTLHAMIQLEQEPNISDAYEYIRLFNSGENKNNFEVYPKLRYLERISMPLFVEVLLWKLSMRVTIEVNVQ